MYILIKFEIKIKHSSYNIKKFLLMLYIWAKFCCTLWHFLRQGSLYKKCLYSEALFYYAKTPKQWFSILLYGKMLFQHIFFILLSEKMPKQRFFFQPLTLVIRFDPCNLFWPSQTISTLEIHLSFVFWLWNFCQPFLLCHFYFSFIYKPTVTTFKKEVVTGWPFLNER
jgi:hypothetical protein